MAIFFLHIRLDLRVRFYGYGCTYDTLTRITIDNKITELQTLEV